MPNARNINGMQRKNAGSSNPAKFHSLQKHRFGFAEGKCTNHYYGINREKFETGATSDDRLSAAALIGLLKYPGKRLRKG
jgi:hypothetical protein